MALNAWTLSSLGPCVLLSFSFFLSLSTCATVLVLSLAWDTRLFARRPAHLTLSPPFRSFSKASSGWGFTCSFYLQDLPIPGLLMYPVLLYFSQYQYHFLTFHRRYLFTVCYLSCVLFYNNNYHNYLLLSRVFPPCHTTPTTGNKLQKCRNLCSFFMMQYLWKSQLVNRSFPINVNMCQFPF